MKSDLDKHIERHLKDKTFKMYCDKVDARRQMAQEIAVEEQIRRRNG